MKQLKTIVSWAATASLVGDAWMTHAAPRDYTLLTLRESQQQLHEQSQIPQSLVFPAETRKPLSTSLQNLEHTVAGMIVAVKQKDSAALRRQLHQLTIDQEVLASLIRKGASLYE